MEHQIGCGDAMDDHGRALPAESVEDDFELVEAIEEQFSSRRPGFRVEDEDLEGLRSVRDAVDYVLARV